MSSFCFFSLVYSLNHNFCNELRFCRIPFESSIMKNKKKYFTETSQIDKPTNPPLKIIFLKLMKKILLSMCYDLCFFNCFHLDGKLFATSKFSDKNFFERKLPLLSFILIVLFFSDQLFLLYKSSFGK
jgi:hypothetical protein